MNNLRLPKKILIKLSFILAVCTNTAFAEPLSWPSWVGAPEVNLGLSWSRFHSNNTHIVISPYETDSVRAHSGSDSNKTNLQVGIGASIFDSYFAERQYLNRLWLQLNYYNVHGRIKGKVWQYGSPQLNNYRYHAPLVSHRLMLDLKPALFTYCNVSPYAILGIGWGWNEFSYRERVTGAGVDPNSFTNLDKRSKNHVAYDLGLGFRMNVNCKVSIYLEYLYTYLGKVTPSNHSHTQVPVISAPSFKVSTNSILLGVNFVL